MIERAVADEIKRRLQNLAAEENVVVLLAVESGSRAWGFESSDSDYDVRFIYIRPPEAYLCIDLETQRDVIERPIVDEVDLSGWDVRKALKLFQRSNPPLLEWLQSPLIYSEQYSFSAELRQLMPAFYSPRNCFHHYFHMARGNVREYLRGEIVWRKKYFYVLRPLLALRWITMDLGAVPMEFSKLVEKTVSDRALLNEIDTLVTAKRAGVEMDRGPRSEIISEFISVEMDKFEKLTNAMPKQNTPVEPLNRLFRSTLDKSWPGWK